ncbi:MAG: hypothetical protein R3F60_07135 [bacterium]
MKLRWYAAVVAMVLVRPALADGYQPQCDAEKTSRVAAAFARGGVVKDLSQVQGDPGAELLYLILAAERFRETGEALPNLPFAASSDLNRAAADVYFDHIRGVNEQAILLKRLPAHGVALPYALMAVLNRSLTPTSIAALKAAGFQTGFLPAGVVGQYVSLRSREPPEEFRKIRFVIDQARTHLLASVVYLRLAELLPASVNEAERYVQELREAGTLTDAQRTAVLLFLLLAGAESAASGLTAPSDTPFRSAYMRLTAPTMRVCLMNRGYVFNTFGIHGR